MMNNKSRASVQFHLRVTHIDDLKSFSGPYFDRGPMLLVYDAIVRDDE